MKLMKFIILLNSIRLNIFSHLHSNIPIYNNSHKLFNAYRRREIPSRILLCCLKLLSYRRLTKSKSKANTEYMT